MIATPEDARLLFDRWMEDSRPLKVRLWTSSVFFDAIGIVAGFRPESLEIRGDSWKITIPIAGANFSFADPREIANPSVREIESAQYEFGIALDLPNGDRLVIMELKGSPEPSLEPDEET
jgi:hypothetical protein